MKSLGVFLRTLGFLGLCFGMLFAPQVVRAQSPYYRVSADPLYWTMTAPEDQGGGTYAVHATEYGRWSKTPGGYSEMGHIQWDIQYGLIVDGVTVAGNDGQVVSDDANYPTTIFIDYVYPLSPGTHTVRFWGLSAWNFGPGWDTGDVTVNVP